MYGEIVESVKKKLNEEDEKDSLVSYVERVECSKCFGSGKDDDGNVCPACSGGRYDPAKELAYVKNTDKPKSNEIQESRPQDFATAEEYVASKSRLFRGGVIDELGGFGGRGIFLTPDKEMASIFAGTKGKVSELFVDKNKLNIKKSVAGLNQQVAKTLDEFTDDLVENPQHFKDKIEKLVGQGVDAVESFDGRQLLVFDQSKIKTKSQLTKEWQDAQVIPKTESHSDMIESMRELLTAVA